MMYLGIQMPKGEATINDYIRRHPRDQAVDSPIGVSLILLSSDISVHRHKRTLRVSSGVHDKEKKM